MNHLVLPAPPRPSVAVDGTKSRFPVRRVFCIGRNYAAHAREMGGDPEREPPFWFAKPPDALVGAGVHDLARIAYPPRTALLHHEVELVVALREGARDIGVERALDLVYGYSVAIDLTRRDLQAQAKERGRPWTEAKGFDQSAPIAPIQPVERVGHPTAGSIWLDVNGDRRQRGDLGDMVWSVAEIISTISRSVAIRPGDVILTGTPSGVGPLQVGDHVIAGVEGVAELAFDVVDPL